MSDETFPVSLGGKSWALPHLPFRAIKAIQPALYDIYVAAGGAAMSSEGVARLGEASSSGWPRRPGAPSPMSNPRSPSPIFSSCRSRSAT